MLDDSKIKVLRQVGSIVLEGIGVYGMFAAGGLLLLGPGFISVVLGLSAVFMLCYWLHRAGWSLR